MEGENKCLREETIQNFTISPCFCPFVDQRIDAEGEKKKKVKMLTGIDRDE